jgi:hypothetical protein
VINMLKNINDKGRSLARRVNSGERLTEYENSWMSRWTQLCWRAFNRKG